MTRITEGFRNLAGSVSRIGQIFRRQPLVQILGEASPVVLLRPVQERDDFGSGLGKIVHNGVFKEVGIWERTDPEIFRGEAYKKWQRLSDETFEAGLKDLGVPNDRLWVEAQQILPSLLIRYAYILTQEGYPYYKKPATWALATALSIQLTQELDYGEFDDYREDIAQRSRLLSWLIEVGNKSMI